MVIQKVDKMLLKLLIPPMILAFGVSLFVLVMQMLFLWIDELAGKGLGMGVVAELIFYTSFVFVPRALPMSILLATVMVYGGMAETYQLSSFKAGGISLLRVMRSSLWVVLGLTIFSLVSASYLIPQAQLQFRKRIHQINSKKPALALETGVFNDDLGGYSIRIGSKSRNGQDVQNVLLYDMTEGGDRINLIQSDHGKIVMLEEQNIFLMKFYDGTYYQDFRHRGNSMSNANRPFIRTQFREMSVAMDLSAFDMRESNEEMFENQRFNRNTFQLRSDIDTIDKDIVALEEFVEKKIQYDNPMLSKYRSAWGEEDDRPKLVSDAVMTTRELLHDSAALYSYEPDDREKAIRMAISSAENIKNEADLNFNRLEAHKVRRAKVIFEMHTRFSWAISCLVFLFIGAPIGTIVRKGGFGFPLLTSIVFFVTFMMIEIACRKLSQGLAMDPVLASWFGILVMLPIAALVTYMGMNDKKISISIDWKSFFSSKTK